MTNDDALESRHQGEFVLGLLSGGRDNYKNKLLVQDKQTAHKDDWSPPRPGRLTSVLVAVETHTREAHPTLPRYTLSFDGSN